MSLSVSVFVKQWPFIKGLAGSLSDSTMTSSGDGGCRSFLTSLRGKAEEGDQTATWKHSPAFWGELGIGAV